MHFGGKQMILGHDLAQQLGLQEIITTNNQNVSKRVCLGETAKS